MGGNDGEQGTIRESRSKEEYLGKLGIIDVGDEQMKHASPSAECRDVEVTVSEILRSVVNWCGELR